MHTSVNRARSLEMSVGPDGGWLQGHLHGSRDISVSAPGPYHLGPPWGQDACVGLCVGMSQGSAGVGICRGEHVAVAVAKAPWCLASAGFHIQPVWPPLPSSFCLIGPCPLLLKPEYGVLHFPQLDQERRGVQEACASFQHSTEEGRGSSWLGKKGGCLHFPAPKPWMWR